MGKVVFFQLETESDEASVEAIVRVLTGDDGGATMEEIISEMARAPIGFAPNPEPADEDDEEDEDDVPDQGD